MCGEAGDAEERGGVLWVVNWWCSVAVFRLVRMLGIIHLPYDIDGPVPV